MALLLGFGLMAGLELRSPAAVTNAPPPSRGSTNPVTRIREEGLSRSQVMPTLSYLTDAIGPRLTGSPNLRRANEWTRDKMVSWGLTNAALEEWGPFGRGWSVKSFTAQVTAPYTFSLIGAPKAWSPGLDRPIHAEVVHFDPKSVAGLEKFKGRLRGKIVLQGSIREFTAPFEPQALRIADSNLLRLANAPASSSRIAPLPGSESGRRGFMTSNPSTNTPSARPTGEPVSPGRALAFLVKEGVAAVLTGSSQGDGGTFFVAQASLPSTEGRTNPPGSLRIWSTNAFPTVPQVALAVEDFNRMVRILNHGAKVQVALDLQVAFHTDSLMAWNTVAEIPGSDLKDEVVMIGAHLDSWHAGTGATDNAAGVATVMEAVRILRALNLQPRRTIRVGLWSGEEQGLMGSRAYVTRHFSYTTNLSNSVGSAARSPRAEESGPRRSRSSSTNATTKVIKLPEHEKFSAYFNYDNGGGKIRGIYLQGNESVRPLFRQWLAPFADLGAETITLANTGGTDHQAFDGVGLPGFQFIQDPIDYWTRTHHSNQDLYERVQPDDLKQASVIMATFAYQAAMLDTRLPRKQE